MHTVSPHCTAQGKRGRPATGPPGGVQRAAAARLRGGRGREALVTRPPPFSVAGDRKGRCTGRPAHASGGDAQEPGHDANTAGHRTCAHGCAGMSILWSAGPCRPCRLGECVEQRTTDFPHNFFFCESPSLLLVEVEVFSLLLVEVAPLNQNCGLTTTTFAVTSTRVHQYYPASAHTTGTPRARQRGVHGLRRRRNQRGAHDNSAAWPRCLSPRPAAGQASHGAGGDSAHRVCRDLVLRGAVPPPPGRRSSCVRAMQRAPLSGHHTCPGCYFFSSPRSPHLRRPPLPPALARVLPPRAPPTRLVRRHFLAKCVMSAWRPRTLHRWPPWWVT